MKIYFVTARLKCSMEGKGFIQPLHRGQIQALIRKQQILSTASLHTEECLFTLRRTEQPSLAETQKLVKPVPKGCQVVKMATLEHPQEARWSSSATTWGKLKPGVLQKPQLSENNPVP